MGAFRQVTPRRDPAEVRAGLPFPTLKNLFNYIEPNRLEISL